MPRVSLTCTLCVLVCLTGCRSPSAPSAVAGTSDFAGAWATDVTFTECSGMRHCFAQIGRAEPVVLRLQQSGRAVAGLLVTRAFAVDVAGSVTPEGILRLAGSRPAPNEYGFGVRVEEAAVRLDPALGLTGRVRYALEPGALSHEFHPRAVLAGDMVSTVRAPLEPQSRVDGQWSGFAVTRACEGRNEPSCFPLYDDVLHTFSLRVAQTGAAITGQLAIGRWNIPVQGTFTEGTLTLAGEMHGSDGDADRSVVRLVGGTAARSPVGRLGGTLRFALDWHAGSGVHTTTYDVELWDVTLNPPGA
jgi:hypothetical protein